MIDRTIANYKILSKLGEGGMGTVYRGVDVMLDRPVAIKVLHAHISRQPDVIERFRTEATLLARLNDPNIATMYAFLREGDEFFMIMEFVPGKTLASAMKAEPKPTMQESLLIVMKVLSGLAHAHQLGIQHRDIKPANILVAAGDVVKITDFGIARALGSERMTRDLRLVGTLEYLAPERIHGEEGDLRSDLYSVGALLFELLTSRLPFERDSDFELMRAHLEDRVTVPGDVGAQLPQELHAVVIRALAKRPEERFGSAEEMRDALVKVAVRAVPPVSRVAATRFVELSSLEAGVKAPSAAATRLVDVHELASITNSSEPPRRSRLIPALGIAAAILVLIVVVVWTIVVRGPTERTSVPVTSTPERVSQTPPPATAGTGTSASEQPTNPEPAPPVVKPTKPTEADAEAAQKRALKAKKAPMILKNVRRLYIDKMSDDLDSYLKAAISRHLSEFFTMVLDRSSADAILQGTGARGTVTMVDRSGKVVLWSGTANDKDTKFLNLRHGGEQEVAEKLAKQLKKALN